MHSILDKSMIDQYPSRLYTFSLSCALCPRNACHILTCPWNSGPLLYNSSFWLLASRRQDASWRRIQPDILEHEIYRPQPHGCTVRDTRSRPSYIVYIAYMNPLVHFHSEPHYPSLFTLAQHCTAAVNHHGSSHCQGSSPGEHH